jgi:hypothetical protein
MVQARALRLVSEKIECVFLTWMLWSSYNGGCKNGERGGRTYARRGAARREAPGALLLWWMDGMVEDEEWDRILRWEPWPPLYRVWVQGSLQREGSLDRRVESLREVLANLACKLRRVLMLARVWLSSWSCGYIMVGSDMVLLCRSW